MRKTYKTNRFYYLLVFVWLAIDQISKILIRKYMMEGSSIEIIPRFLYLTSHRNQGAALGILSGSMWFFYSITILFIVWIIYYFNNNKSNTVLSLWSFSFLLGGATGNLIDRIFFREVTDFINIAIINFPIFNFADMCLTVGVIFMGLDLIFQDKK